MTLRPVGAWIGATRFDLTFARTPRFWLVHIESSPPAGPGELPLTAGQSFFLEWMGVEREWVRRPRFSGDLQQLGGYATIPEQRPPEPPTPPQRHNNSNPAHRKPASTRAGDRPEQSALHNKPSHEQQQPQQQQHQDTVGTAKAATASTTATGARPAKASVKAVPKAKPLPPPTQPTSGSESETSWPSEDPATPEEEDDASHFMQLAQRDQHTNANKHLLQH